MAAITPNVEFWLEFIHCYKSHPALWKFKSELYKNRNMKNKAHEQLRKKLNKIIPNASISLVKQKINSLRSCYRRELLKTRKANKPGMDKDLLYTPKLWYFKELSFLEDEEAEENKSPDEEAEENKSPIDNEIYEDYFKNNYEEEMIDVKRPDNKKKILIEEISNEFLENSTQDLDEMKSVSKLKGRDEANIFSETWAVMYRKLSSDQQLYAKKAIDEILFQGRLGTLNMNSFQIVSHEETCNRETVQSPSFEDFW